jgi:hypothetical protein
MGRRVRLPKGYATLALPLEYPVKDMGDWRRVRQHYEYSQERLGEGWERVAREHRAAGLG